MEAYCDLAEPVIGYSPLFWLATPLSYVNFLTVCLSVPLSGSLCNKVLSILSVCLCLSLCLSLCLCLS